ncbi:unnamed protein product [Caenorhabditis nigoni]|uniref:C2H2-type domain-containing protein n=1 Tax=Caenorhabditis nigoni TaxID=1611254 RepID=A0A2G5TA25_9PELO|nr:hypothetical protein B9Z55_017653 [Caenorhabditis nigoni]PIC24246.1 hypothetical protein B9Z55_017654 [Caenorhabditis nigoni]
MSFDTYCRECATHFSDPFARVQHVNVVHSGICPPNPEISEERFYTIMANVPQVRAKTCPICLSYFECVGECVFHVDVRHPKPCTVFHPSRDDIITDWEQLVENTFPGTFVHLHRRRRRLSDSSSSSDDDFFYFEQ